MNSKQLLASFLCLAVWVGGPVTAHAQAGLTISPAVVSNTYSGLITLAVTGLANGEKITVRRWIDLNDNRVIDAGEPLMDSFNLSDNSLTNALIGGITNLNVPVDRNIAPGAITATLNFVAAMTLEDIVGHFLYQVVSPTARFTPVTASFAVTNAALAQSVSGTVFGPDGMTPVAHALVVAQDQQKNNPSGGVIADSNGHYFLTLPASSYYLIAALPSYYYNQNLAPSVILTNGMAATNDLTLVNGSAMLSGKIYDTARSNGIPGLMFTLTSGHLFSLGFTDTNGNYSVNLTPSFWTAQPSKQRMARRGLVLPISPLFLFDVTSGGSAGADIGLPKGTALFYGRITNNSNTPYANLEVGASSSTNYDARGYSDPNGCYSVAVLGDNTNRWTAAVGSGKNTPLANFIFNFHDEQTLTNGQTEPENFVGIPATATISGFVQDNSGASVAGVGLIASANIGGKNYLSLNGTTDNSGNYSLSVADGVWTVMFFTGTGERDNLDYNGYADVTFPHWVTVPPTNAVLDLTVYPLGTPLVTQPHRLSSSQFGFTVNGALNANYTVQMSTNLAQTNWSPLFSLQLTNGSVPVIDLNATNGIRFYRVLKN